MTATFTLTACTNTKATGGSGSAVVNFKTVGKGSAVAGKITWHGTGTTTFSLSTAAGKTPNKCPKGTSEFVSTGKVQGGSGAALEGDPEGFARLGDHVFERDDGCVDHLPGHQVRRVARRYREAFVGAAPDPGAAPALRVSGEYRLARRRRHAG